MHLQQLSYQRNQAVKSGDDFRRKYIARLGSEMLPSYKASAHLLSRQLFRKVAAERRLVSPDTNMGPFKLWCDDFRPVNILINEHNRIVGVVDWEFTYAAPTEFTYSPPWWLLLAMPEEWPQGLNDWAAKYEPRLEMFLLVMEAKERNFIEEGRLDQSQVLSRHMRRSWETGDFWVAYAARKSWAFDGIYWRSLDKLFFGNDGDSIKDRLILLPSNQAAAMEGFVERKMQEKEECRLIDWYVEESDSNLPPDIHSLC